MIKDKIYIATFAEKAVSVARKNNLKLEIDELCISENLDAENMSKTRKRIRSEFMETAGVVGSDTFFHGPFTEVCPSAIDHKARDFARQRLESAYSLVRDLGSKNMVVHSGYIPFIYMPEWHVKNSIEFWTIFMENKSDNFNLYIENVLDETPEMLNQIIGGIGDKRVKVCLDVGHANVMGSKEYEPAMWIKTLGDKIGHYHLHNNYKVKDIHNPLGEGDINYNEILKCIEEYSPDATITIESRDAEESVKWLCDNQYI